MCGHRFQLMVTEARIQALVMNSQGAPSKPQLLYETHTNQVAILNFEGITAISQPSVAQISGISLPLQFLPRLCIAVLFVIYLII